MSFTGILRTDINPKSTSEGSWAVLGVVGPSVPVSKRLLHSAVPKAVPGTKWCRLGLSPERHGSLFGLIFTIILSPHGPVLGPRPSDG